MSKVGAVVKDALGYLGVTDPNEDVAAEDMVTALRQLNLMLRRWEANGLSLGWNDVDNPDDDMPVPAEAEEAIGYNLALKLRPHYGVQIAPDVVEFARVGYNTLLRDQEVATPIQPLLDVPTPDRWGSSRWQS